MILRDCWSLYIANEIILATSSDYEQVFSYTYFPYTPNHCGVVEPIVLDHFENGAFVRGRTTFFPDKFRNFHKCPLIMSTYNFTPFMIMTPLDFILTELKAQCYEFYRND